MNEGKKVCYGDLGCFFIDDFFDNIFGYFFEFFEVIYFGLIFYIRINFWIGVNLGYNDFVLVVRFSFNFNNFVKIIIYGYMVNVYEFWVFNILSLFLKKVC